MTSSDPRETCFCVCWSTCSLHTDWTELCLNLCQPSLGLVLVVCLLRRHHLRWLQSAMTHPVNPDGTYLFRGTTQEPCQPSGNIHGPHCYPIVFTPPTNHWSASEGVSPGMAYLNRPSLMQRITRTFRVILDSTCIVIFDQSKRLKPGYERHHRDPRRTAKTTQTIPPSVQYPR